MACSNLTHTLTLVQSDQTITQSHSPYPVPHFTTYTTDSHSISKFLKILICKKNSNNTPSKKKKKKKTTTTTTTTTILINEKQKNLEGDDHSLNYLY
jgi:hypothetical protein